MSSFVPNTYGGGAGAPHSGSFSLESTLSSPLSGSNHRVQVARVEERGIESSSLARFENQVLSHWLPRVFAGNLEEGMTLYRNMRAQKAITFEVFSAKRLAAMYTREKLHWCENVLHQHKIDSINLPMDPEYDLLLDEVGGPVTFIGHPGDEGRVTIVQGNHRTAAVLFKGQERNESLYVLRFRGPRDSQEFMKISPDISYLSPKIPEKYARLFVNGVPHGRA